MERSDTGSISRTPRNPAFPASHSYLFYPAHARTREATGWGRVVRQQPSWWRPNTLIAVISAQGDRMLEDTIPTSTRSRV